MADLNDWDDPGHETYSVADLVQASMRDHAQRQAQQMSAQLGGMLAPPGVVFTPGSGAFGLAPASSGLVLLPPGAAPLQPGTGGQALLPTGAVMGRASSDSVRACQCW